MLALAEAQDEFDWLDSLHRRRVLASFMAVLPRPSAYSAAISPEPPNSAGKSFSLGNPSRMGRTVSE